MFKRYSLNYEFYNEFMLYQYAIVELFIQLSPTTLNRVWYDQFFFSLLFIVKNGRLKIENKLG